MGFAGVDLDAKLGGETSPESGGNDLAPETSDKVSESPDKPEARESDKPESSEKPTLLDLDKHDRFLFNKREMTRKEFQDSLLRREDYTKKMMEVGEARKYSDNFAYDLMKVVENPALISEMRRLYPKSYVEMAERFLGKTGRSSQKEDSPTNEPAEGGKLDNQLLQRLEKFESFIATQEQREHEVKVSQIETELNSWFSEFEKKYNFADPDAVLNKALAQSELGKEVNRGVIEALFKKSQEFHEGRFKALQSKRVEEQKKANAKGKDIGLGGSPAGSPPPKYKSLRDVRKAYDKSLD